MLRKSDRILYILCFCLSSYAISDALTTVYDFKLTPGHIPIQGNTRLYTCIPPSHVPGEGTAPTAAPAGRGRGVTIETSGPFASRDIRYRVSSSQAGWWLASLHSGWLVIGQSPFRLVADCPVCFQAGWWLASLHLGLLVIGQSPVRLVNDWPVSIQAGWWLASLQSGWLVIG